jgi:NADH dehydrogenase
VTAVVPERNTVQTTHGELAYDYLVIASGSRTNYFHIPGVAEYSMSLKTLPEAMNIRSILLENVEKALTEEAGPGRESLLTVVVVGGGPTGVEMAGAIAELRQHEFATDYREMDPGQMRVILLEKGPKLLAGMSESASVKSLEFLRGLGVQVRLHTGLAAYDGQTARLEDGSALPTRCLLFTAGVDANPVPGLAEGVYGKANRIRVDEHLRVEGYANVFAIGDVAAVSSAAHPMLAQPAMQQGSYLGKYLKARLSSRTAPFRYKDLGSWPFVGRNKAVADFSWGRFGGVLAWLLWLGIHLVQLVGFRNRAVVLVNWAISYLGWASSSASSCRPEPRYRQPIGGRAVAQIGLAAARPAAEPDGRGAAGRLHRFARSAGHPHHAGPDPDPAAGGRPVPGAAGEARPSGRTASGKSARKGKPWLTTC